MPREADIPLEVPVALPARVYEAARVRYFTDTKAPRRFDDERSQTRTELLPAFAPNGGRVARRITAVDRYSFSGWIDSGGLYVFGEPADDVALLASDLVETSTPPGTMVRPAAAPVVLRRGQAAPPAPPPVFVPDASRVAVIVAPPAFSRVPAPNVMPRNAAKPRVELYPRPVDDRAHVGLLAVEDPNPEKHGRYLVRRDGMPLATDRDWWKTGPNADTLVVFAPHSLRGPYAAIGPAELRELDAPDLALIRDDHPWIPTANLPPAEGLVAIGTSVDFDHVSIGRFRQVRTRYVIVSVANRTGARRRTEGWIGHHVEHPSGNTVDKALDLLPGDLEKGLRSVVRSAAFEAVLTIAAGAISFGAGAGFAQAALAGAGHVGVDVGGFVGAALPGAQLSGSPAGQGPAVSLASSPARAPASPVNDALAVAGKAAPDARKVAPVAAPKAVNRVLEEAAKGSSFLAGFDSPYGVFLREAIIQAQLSPRDRDALRLRLATITADVNRQGGDALLIARTAWQVVRSVVLAGAGSGLDQAAEAALAVAQRSVSLLSQGLQAANEKELLAIVDARVQAKQLEIVRDLEALLSSQLEAAAPEPAPATVARAPLAPAAPSTPGPTTHPVATFFGRVGDTVIHFFQELASWPSTSTSTSVRSSAPS